MKTLETLKPSRISPIWGGFPGRASFFGQKQPKLASDRLLSDPQQPFSWLETIVSVPVTTDTVTDTIVSLTVFTDTITDTIVSLTVFTDTTTDTIVSLTVFTDTTTDTIVSLTVFTDTVTDTIVSLTVFTDTITDTIVSLTVFTDTITDTIVSLTVFTDTVSVFTNTGTLLINIMVNNRHLAVERLKKRQFSGLNHQGTKSARIFTAPLARQTTAHSSSCGWTVEHFFRRRNVAEE
jgi:hypothetical protein